MWRFFLTFMSFAVISPTVHAACGDRGGPGFRNASGKCVGWDRLASTCGTPPTLRCTYEGGGTGDTSKQGGEAYLAALATGSSGAFNKRKVRAEGMACTSQLDSARTSLCLIENASADCRAIVEAALQKGDCAKLEVGKEATIEAGSHSFDWVRIRVEGLRRPLWSPRSLILE